MQPTNELSAELKDKVREILFYYDQGLQISGVVESINVDYDKLAEVRKIAWDRVEELIAKATSEAESAKELEIAKNILDMQNRGFSDRGILQGFYDWAKGVVSALSQPEGVAKEEK